MSIKPKEPQTGNPFGRWTNHRAKLARLVRAGGDASEELDLRQQMKAARLADAILAARDELTEDQRERIAALLDGS
jgi:hypothetical protein